jgi:hypothetical protein
VEHNGTVGKALFELQAGAAVLAIADMKGTVFISPHATEQEFDHAVWKHRARKTVDVPPGFERHALAELPDPSGHRQPRWPAGSTRRTS